MVAGILTGILIDSLERPNIDLLLLLSQLLHTVLIAALL